MQRLISFYKLSKSQNMKPRTIQKRSKFMSDKASVCFSSGINDFDSMGGVCGWRPMGLKEIEEWKSSPGI